MLRAMDLLYLALATGFFALSIGLIALFERVRGEP
jgi:hypothetical protein